VVAGGSASAPAARRRLRRPRSSGSTLIAYPDRLWVPEACDGRGAWYIEEQSLAKLARLFSNYSLMRWWAEEAERLRAQAAQAEAERQRHEAEQRQRKPQAMPLRPPTTYQQAFALLGLPVSASRRRIQRAYRQLALHAHPDHGGSHQGMVALNAAYQLALAYAQANPAA
jgi:DnaJ domain